MSNEVMGTDREMPKYRSHKEVWALKIKAIDIDHNAGDNAGAIIIPEDEGYGPFYVPSTYVAKHDPKVGGYYVRYEDGYDSWSPAEAFENGYTRI